MKTCDERDAMAGNELTLAVKPDDLMRVEAIASQCSLEAIATQGHFMRAFRMAAGIRALRDAITSQMMREIMSLQGSKLGFRTDKDRDSGYPENVVKDCAIEAALRGAHWVGNEFNIISGSCYLTREFFTRKLAEFPGFANLRIEFGAPVLREAEKRAWVAVRASWTLNGRTDSIDKKAYKIDGTDQMLDERIVVKLNSGMGDDAVLGKADRKIKAAIYARITGSQIDDRDVDEVEGRKTNGTIQDLDRRLTGTVPDDTHDRPQTTPEPDPDFTANLKARLAECDTPALVDQVRADFMAKASSASEETVCDFECTAAKEALAKPKGRQTQKALT
jgi:hypothetical protein